MYPRTLTALALPLLLMGGPLLVFPELVAAELRAVAITALGFAAVGVALAALRPWSQLTWGLSLFVTALVASWIFVTGHDGPAIRHFAGICVGLLTMAVIATWCVSEGRLVLATAIFAVLATVVVVLGALNAFITNAKFITDSTQKIWSTPVLPWVRQIKMGLPGLEHSEGLVNQNALGGVAVMVLPVCAALFIAGMRSERFRSVVMILGATATVAAIGVLGRSLSRTTWLAAVAVLLLLALRWNRGRYWVLSAMIAGTIGGSLIVSQARPADFHDGLLSVANSASSRTEIWGHAANRIAAAPMLGIGINHFHEGPAPTAGAAPPYVAHAHNVLIQVALDLGLVGLSGYLLLYAALLIMADGLSRAGGVTGYIAAGSALSLVAVHVFGIADTIALGAKVGIFQWMCAGLILAAWRVKTTDHRPQLP